MTTRAERDAEYRAALGVPAGAALPKKIGQTGFHSHNPASGNRPFYTSALPYGPGLTVNVSACDRALRGRRGSVAQRAVPAGDVDAALTEFDEAIERAVLARDTARTPSARLAAGSYVVRLRARRDALLDAARVGQPEAA